MSILDRLGRMARAEVSEMKRVLAEARREARSGSAEFVEIDATLDEIARYEADIAAAEAELASAQDNVSATLVREAAPFGAPLPPGRIDDDALARGASLWGPAPSASPVVRAPAAAVTQGDPTGGASDVARGASLWGQPAERAGGASPPAPEPARAAARPGRTEAFPREVREAYAALELPLGADRSRIEQAKTELMARFHPDRHVGQPELQQTALTLAQRIEAARNLLFDWLEGRR